VAADELNQRDARLVQWLQEAHAKEAELEADLTAHIGLTQKASYKKRLQTHRTETRDHKRQVARRLKALGGAPGNGGGGPIPGPVAEVAGKTVALLKGQLGLARAAATEQVETHLRNAQEELREEHVEIALYSRIETFAAEVGDRETAKLAAGIRREEERMAKFLDAEITRLVKELVRSEVPKDQRQPARRTSRSGRPAAGSRAKATGSHTRAIGSRTRSGSASRPRRRTAPASSS
jgi:ferritin-like metal-binding protein YciE